MAGAPHLQGRPAELGPLCKNGHDHEGSGQSLRFLVDDPRKDLRKRCVACEIAWYERRRKRPKKARKAAPAKAPQDAPQAVADSPAPPDPPEPEPRPRLSREHQVALHTVAEEVAGFYAKRFRVPFEDLLQEAWVHAMDAHASYWARTDLEHSIKGMRGWVYRWVRVRLAMFTRKNTCPVSFPKKAVPDAIRDGVRAVSMENVAMVDRFDTFEEVSQREIRSIVDQTMGKALSSYPLARAVIREAVSAPTAAANLTENDIIREVRRQAHAARQEIKNRLEAVLYTTTKETHDCGCPNAAAGQCAPGGPDQCAT